MHTYALKIRHGGSVAEAVSAKITRLRRTWRRFRNEQTEGLLAAQAVHVNKRQGAVGIQSRRRCPHPHGTASA